jgi:hypothetical protein
MSEMVLHDPFGRLKHKLWAPKAAGVPTLGISGKNDIWVLVPWLGTKYTRRGGRWWLPPSLGHG